jgi:sigma-B regulation protein RsbU (phosphoserine phosphatase)
VTGAVTALPPDGRSAGVARRTLQRALNDAGLDVMLDDALLLVTELVTNAVVHAGTDIELHIEVGAGSARVEVVDHSAGTLPVLHGDPDAPREGGRGIYLLDVLAREWGTRHFAGGKSVWFALGLVDRSAPRPLPLRRQDPGPAADPPDLSWLLGLPADLEERLTPSQLLAELLHRLCVGMDLSAGWLLTQGSAEDDPWELVAAHDASAPGPDPDEVRRQARGGSDRLLGAGDRALLLLPLRSRAGVFGALVLAGGEALDESAVAVARLVGDRMGVVVRDDRAHSAQLRDRGSLALLAEASEMFAGTLDVTLAVTLAAQLVVPRFATWSAVYVLEEDGARLAALTHRDEAEVPRLQERLLAGDAARTVDRLLPELREQPSLLARAHLEAVLGDEPLHDEVLAVPLVARRHPLGLLLAGRGGTGRYAREDVGLLLDLARRAALSIDNARLYQERTQIAQALQASLLPPDLPTAPGVAFGARYAAAGGGNDVGGDFYDVFSLHEHGWGVAIGDVCGKGAEAAAITGLARNVLRLLTREGRSTTDALRHLNAAILELGDRGRFCTASLATLQRQQDRLVVRLSSAGHPQPVLVQADGTVGFVGSSGDLLGVLDEVEVGDDEVQLAPGDALVFYTDGVTERRDGSTMFGEHNLLTACRSAAGGSADDIAGALEQAVRTFSVDAARDDMAVLIVQATSA